MWTSAPPSSFTVNAWLPLRTCAFVMSRGPSFVFCDEPAARPLAALDDRDEAGGSAGVERRGRRGGRPLRGIGGSGRGLGGGRGSRRLPDHGRVQAGNGVGQRRDILVVLRLEPVALLLEVVPLGLQFVPLPLDILFLLLRRLKVGQEGGL